MNVAEKLAREIGRVSYIRQYYEAIGPNGQLGLMMINQSLEAAYKAAGVDIVAQITALKDLEGIHE
jgi:hypothetical protein